MFVFDPTTCKVGLGFAVSGHSVVLRSVPGKVGSLILFQAEFSIIGLTFHWEFSSFSRKAAMGIAGMAVPFILAAVRESSFIRTPKTFPDAGELILTTLLEPFKLPEGVVFTSCGSPGRNEDCFCRECKTAFAPGLMDGYRGTGYLEKQVAL